MSTRVEYVGFSVNNGSREYALRIWRDQAAPQEITLAIPNEAFLRHQVRYQDAPEVCFLTLQRRLAATLDGALPARLAVTDADLEDYRSAHLPKAPQRRPRPPVPA